MGAYDFPYGSYFVPQNSSAPVYFDCVTKEQVVRDADVTEFPVEQGVNITDHYRVKVTELHLEVFVSQEPLWPEVHPEGNGATGQASLQLPNYPSFQVPSFDGSQLSSPGAALGAGLGAVGSATAAVKASVNSLFSDRMNPIVVNVLQWSTPFDSLNALLTRLDGLRSNASLVDVFTRSWHYENLLITNVTTERDKETGTGTNVSISFKTIVTVTTQTGYVALPTNLVDKATINKGPQQPQDPGQKTSFALAIKNGLASTFGH